MTGRPGRSQGGRTPHVPLPKGKKAATVTPAQSDDDDSSSEEEGVVAPPAGRGRGGKKKVTASPPAKGKQAQKNAPASESDESTEEEEPPTPSGRGGKKAAATGTPASGSQQDGSQGSSQKKGKGRKSWEVVREMSKDDLKVQVSQYFLIHQHKKVPLKKSEIVKNAMNSQNKDFLEVMDEVIDLLDDTFGFNLKCLKADEEGKFHVVPLKEANTFLGISRFDSLVVRSFGDLTNTTDQENEAKRGFVQVLLNCINMRGRDRDVDEDFIWQMIVSLECQEEICPRREDLRKFLKSECVDPMYLTRREIKGVDVIVFRYAWGIRAELEMDLYGILKHVSKSVGKHPQTFRTQYHELSKSKEYKRRMDEDRAAELLSQSQGDNDEDRADLSESLLEEIGDTQNTPGPKKVSKPIEPDTDTDSD